MRVRAMLETLKRREDVWRKSRIERFTKRQRLAREWINFAEVADFLAREDGSIVPDEKKRITAFNTLSNDILSGEFEKNGRSKVLFLNPCTRKIRLTPAELQDVIEYNYDGNHGLSEYLPYCWAPREVMEGWLEKHRLEKPSGWFMAPRRETAQRSAALSERRLEHRSDLSEDELKQLVINIADEDGRIPSQNKCAEKVRKSYPQITRDRVRAAFHQVFPGMKQGLGPRKKCAG
jgi:hypothetical protein